MRRDGATRPVRPAAGMTAATWAMAILAAATLHLAMEPAATAAGTLAGGAALAVATGIAAVVVARSGGPAFERHGSGAALAGVAATTAIASAAEIALRDRFGGGIVPEHAILVPFRDAVLLLALAAPRGEGRRLGALLAMFLVVFATALSDSPAVTASAVATAVAGAWWLFAAHRGTLAPGVVAASRRTRPRSWVAGAVAVAMLLVAAIPFPAGRLRALAGFMPTSGGRERGDDALSGVGDGDRLVAGMDDIRSFAPIDDAPFMTSHEPALHDLFDDTYDPPQPVRETQRAVSLPPQAARSAERHDMSTAENASREFALVRAVKADRGRADDLRSTALFHVKGRVPLHLGLVAYDRFDGVAWHPEAAPLDAAAGLRIEHGGGAPWLRMHPPAPRAARSGTESHAIRIVHLRECRIPSPPGLSGVHVKDVAQADFFRWAQPGILRVDRDTIPPLLPIHLESVVVDPRRRDTIPLLPGTGPAEYLLSGSDPDSVRVGELARSWVAGVPAGWPQVERVVERVRSLHRLDPAVRAGGDSGHVVADFLFRTRAGPDYLFASAAAEALRALGYPTRLVAGFYVRPERHDARAGHTPVLPEDVHVWIEVAPAPGAFVTFDPTPGHEVLGPRPDPIARLVEAIAALAAAVAARPFSAACAAGAAIAVWRTRKRLADAVDACVERVRPAATGRRRVALFVARLDRRCRRAGLGRPRHVSPSRWLGTLAGAGTAADDALGSAIDLALYGPVEVEIDPGLAVSLRAAAERRLSWARLRSRAARGGPGSGPAALAEGVT